MRSRITALVFATALLLIPGAPARAETPALTPRVFLPRIVTPLPEVLFHAAPSTGYTQIFSARADGSGRVMLTQPTQGRNTAPHASPDHTTIVFSSNRDAANKFSTIQYLYLMDADGGRQRRLTAAVGQHESAPVWSPDSRRLAFKRGEALYVIQADGRDERLVSSMDSTEVRWSLDSQWLAFQVGSEVHRIDADGRNDRVIVKPCMRAVWSADMTRLLYDWFRSGDGGRRLSIVSADGTGTQVLTDTALLVQHLAWSPAGDRITMQAEQRFPDGSRRQHIYLMRTDGGPLVDLLHGGYASVWAPDGGHVAYSTDLVVAVADRDGNNTRILYVRPGFGVSTVPIPAAWSRDGAWVGFTVGHSGSPFSEILIAPPDGSLLLRPSQDLLGASGFSWK